MISARPRARRATAFAELARGGHRVAFVFGGERFGLSNEHVHACHLCLSIPTQPEYGSLNLAQAVQLLSYDWRQALGGFPVVERERRRRCEADATAVRGLLSHWRETLVAIDFLDPAVPRKLMARLHQLVNRAQRDYRGSAHPARHRPPDAEAGDAPRTATSLRTRRAPFASQRPSDAWQRAASGAMSRACSAAREMLPIHSPASAEPSAAFASSMFSRLREDIACILERDPAARSRAEVLLCYPGLHALIWHRRCEMALDGMACTPWLRASLSQPGPLLHRRRDPSRRHASGRRVFIDHGMGVVIGEMAEIHDDCTIYQGVTLGGTSLVKGAKRHPTLERGVIVGANASVLGGFTVGAGARVGSGAVVTRPVPAGATAVGNPARIIAAETDAAREATAARLGFSAYGVTQGDDPVALAMKGLIDNASSHEHQIMLLWAALERVLAEGATKAGDCVPTDAQTAESFDAEGLSRLVK